MTDGLAGLGLLVGHLCGDYLLQTDWMAQNKVNPRPDRSATGPDDRAWQVQRQECLRGDLACSLHCLLYTVAVAACSWRWLPWWALLLCGLIHWPIDRFRLARRLMDYTGQKAFAQTPLAPWSIIVVDNTWHLLTLYLLALAA